MSIIFACCLCACVAPCAGAWVEILSVPELVSLIVSLPVRERGLKYTVQKIAMYLRKVAPCAGAWVEIRMLPVRFQSAGVAPCAGAWVEIK